jgi:hypothetical protein
MHDSHRVRGVERVRELSGPAQHERARDPPALESLLKGLTEQFQDEEGSAAGSLLVAETHYTRQVTEAPQRVGFPSKSLTSNRIASEPGVQPLHDN